MDNIEIISNIFDKCRILYTEKQLKQLVRYYELMIEKNKVMNLTAITEFNEVCIKHFADSLSIQNVIKIESQNIIDIGTGAGFPGIPLKIMYPDTRITLLDSLNKRLVFLKEVIDDLGLKNIEVIHARAEEGARNPVLRERFDIVVSRAVANLSTLSEYCLPYAKIGGYFISYKGAKAQEELAAASKAINILGGKVCKTEEFELSEEAGERTLIKIEKCKETPKTYPRSGGQPGKNPLN